MMSSSSSTSSPISKNLLDVARAHTTGLVSTHKHVASRVLVVDSPAAGGKWLPKPASRKKEVFAIIAGVAMPAFATIMILVMAFGKGQRFNKSEGVIAPDHLPASTAASAVSASHHKGSGPVDANNAIARMRPGFRKCYSEVGLAKDPNMSGSAAFFVRVAADGHVDNVSVASNDGLSVEVTNCMSNVISAGQFAASGEETTVRVPVTFVQTR